MLELAFWIACPCSTADYLGRYDLGVVQKGLYI